MSAPPMDLDARKAKALEELEKRKKAKETARKERDVRVLELELEFEDKFGPRGSSFEIVDPRDPEGNPLDEPIVLVLGEAVLFTRFTNSKVTPTDVHDFVFPCVESPAKEKYVAIVDKRPELAGRCAHALMTLYGAKHKDDSGKF